MSVLATVQLVCLAALAFAWAAGAMISWLVGPTLALTARWQPARRHRALAVLASSPPLFFAAALGATLWPSLAAIVWPAFDHCLLHDDGHAHLCFAHGPTGVGNLGWWIPPSLGIAWFAMKTARGGVELRAALRLATRLRRAAPHDPVLGAFVLPSDQPLCLALGIVAPMVTVSQGLLDRIDRDAIGIVLEHERAHARRRDPLVRLLARVSTVLLRSGPRRRLLAALELAAERSCDEHAALRCGDRLRTASAILTVERALQPVPAAVVGVAASIGGDTVPLRVEALLEEPITRGHRSSPFGLVAIAIALVLAASEPLHHLTESLLGALIH